ncbi:hypothetical protein A0H76_374 [Hepatospora eriocheir]|uniref:Uncharacterized protein n=1 Tax=Hepatospora eriocheir TaxID=1081669 RepID=A0A1X0QBJ1_9MICR|nr:hypothetical protein A0H76_374 [Hepatospora eriocheir]
MQNAYLCFKRIYTFPLKYSYSHGLQRGYGRVNEDFKEHFTVNDSKFFIDLKNQCHTQLIESVLEKLN